jgi:hypothetical protein
MAVVRAYGKPDLFITVTCNPKWPEVLNELKPGKTPNDRPDLLARIFRLKLKAIIDDLNKNQIFGKVIGRVHVIEFQKRGLPHAHILIILHENDKPRTVEQIDSIVSAELPDPVKFPQLFDTVSKSLIHGPCGKDNPHAPCMVNGKCSKRFPKQFSETTSQNPNGYPVYRRRDSNIRVTRKTAQGTIDLDNRWVVPHNMYLTHKYNCHINVEVCATVTAVKYLYKYVYKG